ncbi:type I secretion C-terminal target domain-containing protein [Kluyvera ascorbata]|uniref:type I secretion C-terminal target domain-containing protein n=1 Tax=Kluyvera ascorbata TaxID=51288 RepID=UPI00290370E1|nr:type I secretion C-terminal target domain-containing protein [Kluyvera ascorbata]MDU1198632.1 type I secretion C-terminal target domain-containing protein [Kluyvera ascorbata]
MPENPASYRVVRTKSYLFNKAIHEDKIDLTELLEGIKGNFSDFVNISDKGGDTIITINTGGLHHGGNATEVQITVENCTSTDIDSLIAKPDTLV